MVDIIDIDIIIKFVYIIFVVKWLLYYFFVNWIICSSNSNVYEFHIQDVDISFIFSMN